MFRLLMMISLFSTPAFSLYIDARSGIPLARYLELGKLQSDAVSIVHPSLPGQVTSCSGIIFEGYVLTAGHCVTDEQGKLLSNPELYVISQGAQKQNPDYIMYGETVYLHPQYAILPNGGRAHDVAIIKLGFTQNVPKCGILAATSAVNPDKLTGFGYGIVGDNVHGITDQTNEEIHGYEITVQGRQTQNTELIALKFDSTLDLPGIAAPGDSGGGLKNSKGEIVGITSSINSVSSTQSPTYMYMVDVIKVLDFINSVRPNFIPISWSGTGNISNPDNWSEGFIPQNSSTEYYLPNRITSPTDIIIDKDLSITEFTISNPASHFTVNLGKTVSLGNGLDFKGYATINGSLRGKFLRVGGEYSSPQGMVIYGNGEVALEAGVIKTPSFLMDGGRVSGQGTITTPLFIHKDGYLDPGVSAASKTMTIDGAYQQSGSSSTIAINLFSDKTCDLLKVSRNNSSTLNFFLDFPNKEVALNTPYLIFQANSSQQTSALAFTINPYYTSKGSYTWKGNQLLLTLSELARVGLEVQVTSNTRADVPTQLQNARQSGSATPASLFKEICAMSRSIHYQDMTDELYGSQAQENPQQNLSSYSSLDFSEEFVDLFLR